MINSKRDKQARIEHMNYLQDNNISSDKFTPIVVDTNVTELSKWKL